MGRKSQLAQPAPQLFRQVQQVLGSLRFLLNDRNGPPPWGWGPPPAYQWDGGPPRPFNYWGYNANPVWNDGFGQWGIWLFGLWIPIFGVGVR